MKRFALILIMTPGCFSEPTEPLATGSTGDPASSSGDLQPGSSSDNDAGGESSGFGTWGSSSTGWILESSTGSSGGDSDDTSTTTGPQGTCGNGEVEAGEVCDEPSATLETGACRPDCAGVIESRTIRVSNTSVLGDLGQNPVATVDALCPAGHRAMFSDGENRRATTVANGVFDPVDWVLEPYTAYVNANGALLWVTDEVALLGVRTGTTQTLLAPIVAFEDNPPGCITGMNADWTAPASADCLGWSTAAASEDHNVGIPWVQDVGAFLNNGGITPCNLPEHVYCVEG
ncbi:MAG: DUF1554 domain-containing protein [Nannocystales bacterium]